jgi:uncharacterized coiled-coil protein SlyX
MSANSQFSSDAVSVVRLQERLTELEIRYTQLESLVDELSDLLRQRSDQLDRLERQLLELTDTGGLQDGDNLGRMEEGPFDGTFRD